MPMLRVTIVAEQPLLATQLLGDPNSSVSLDYIPGSLIRGAVIGVLRAQNGGQPLDPTAHEHARWFDGQVRFLNAYPQVDNRRSLPLALSYLRPKHDDQTLYDAACDDFNHAHHDELVPVRGGFSVAENAAGLIIARPQREVNLHVQRDRQLGRATSERGAVFSYDALAPNQAFVTYILCEQNAHQQQLRGLDLATLWLGRSRSAGYGRARITIQPVDEPEDPAADDHEIDQGEWGVVTLLSDSLLRDEHGAPATRWTDGVLGRLLGASVTLDESRSWSSLRVHGGHNATWQLPTPQHAALVAGSRAVFRADQALTGEQVTRLRWLGVGARTIDGYGRISIGRAENLTCQLTVRPQPSDQALIVPHAAPATPLTYADNVSLKIWYESTLEHMIATKLRDRVKSNLSGSLRIPPRSQLARVRVTLRNHADAASALNAVRDQIAGYAPTARSYLENCRLAKKSLYCILDRLCVDDPPIWAELGIVPGQFPNVPNDLLIDRARAARVTRQYLDALLAALTKK
jgi:CRISPR-associated protein Csx10